MGIFVLAENIVDKFNAKQNSIEVQIQLVFFYYYYYYLFIFLYFSLI